MKFARLNLLSGLRAKSGLPSFEAGDMLAGKIVVCQQSAAVCVTLQCLVVQCAEQLVHIDFHAECFCKLFENIYPCIQIGRAVVAVYHCHQTVRAGVVTISISIVRLRKVLLQYDHGKYRGSCGYVSGTYWATLLVAAIPVPASPSGGHIGNACSPDLPDRIKLLCALLQSARLRSRLLLSTFGRISRDLPAKALIRYLCLELIQHLCIVICFVAVSMGNIPDASPTPSHLLTGQLPVNVTCQRGHECDLLHMLLAV